MRSRVKYGLACVLIVLLTPLSTVHGKDNPVAPPVKNASMTEGKEKPAGWTNQWVGSGKIAVSRDTGTYHSEPASFLRSARGVFRSGRRGGNPVMCWPAR